MADTYVQSVGRRKRAIAQVRLYPGGDGTFTVNEKKMKEYFNTPTQQETAQSPLKQVGKLEDVTITVRVVGGGKTGQADAVKLGIARALVEHDENLRTTLKAEGFLTRDARKKERKKFGLRKARRAQQWRKR